MSLDQYTRRNVTPLGNNVLLAPLVQVPKSDGGIWLVDRYQDDRKQWVVLAVGPGRKLKNGSLLPPEVKVGQKVLFNPQVPTWVKYVFEDGSRWTLVDARGIEMVW